MSRHRFVPPHWLILAIYAVSALVAVLIVATLPPRGDSVPADLWFPVFGVAIATLGWVVQARGGSFAVLALGAGAAGAPEFPRIPPISAIEYLGLGLIALVACWVAGVRDEGGYLDTFRGQFDKQAHAAAAAALTLAAVLAGVAPVDAALVTIVLGVGLEFVQRYHRDYVLARRSARGVVAIGFWSWRDVVSNTAGAVVAATFAVLCGR